MSTEQLVDPELLWVLESVDHRPDTKAESALVAEVRRLAEALAASRAANSILWARVQRVEALCELDQNSLWRDPKSKTVGLTEQRDGYTVTSTFVRVNDVRHALAGDTEGAS